MLYLPADDICPADDDGEVRRPMRDVSVDSSQPDFSAPVEDRYFEDYVPGFEQVYGPVTVTEAEVIEFGRRFDPQDMHTDPEKAARGPFGGLIASGWHTAALLMRLYATHYLSHVAGLASPGLDRLRWHKPVRPGDELRIRVRVLTAERSRSKPDRGMVHTGIEVLNQRGEVVMSLRAMNLMRCRGAA
jgi:acyl dehydratase